MEIGATIISVETASGERVLAAIPQDEVFDAGSMVEFRFEPAAAHLFAAERFTRRIDMGLEISGKVAAITGAASGIGLECAKCLLNAGARVCLSTAKRNH